MKKTSKLFGAVALSAALALGAAVPAFADNAVSVSDPTQAAGNGFAVKDSDKTQGDATTNVNVATHISQIKVTIPLNMVIDADLNGGDAVTPSAGSYGIKNESSCELYVKSAKATKESGWEFAPTKHQAATVATKTGTTGDIFMSVQPGTWDSEATAGSEFTALKTTAGGSTDVTPVTITSDNPVIVAQQWKIPAASTMALKTEASTSVLDGIGIVPSNAANNGTSGATPTANVKAFTVVYTIGTTAL